MSNGIKFGGAVGASIGTSLSANSQLSATASQAASFSLDASLDLSFGIGLGSGYKTGLLSSADWQSSLRPMSFKGVVFPITQVKGSAGRKLVKHVYPYRPGQEVVDLGRQALTINVSAVFSTDHFLVQAYGRDLYPGRYEMLMNAIHQGGSGELVHPVFGSLKAACESYSDTTQANELNTVRLELTFVEDDVLTSVPLVGTSAMASAKKSAGLLDRFAASMEVDLTAAVGMSFGDVAGQIETALSVQGKAQFQVAAELELAAMNIEMLTGALPSLDDPINVEAKAELASFSASLNMAGTEYLAGAAPIVTYVTTTQTTTVDIAKEKYQDPGRATEIEQFNSIPDPLNIPPGTELKIYAY